MERRHSASRRSHGVRCTPFSQPRPHHGDRVSRDPDVRNGRRFARQYSLLNIHQYKDKHLPHLFPNEGDRQRAPDKIESSCHYAKNRVPPRVRHVVKGRAPQLIPPLITAELAHPRRAKQTIKGRSNSQGHCCRENREGTRRYPLDGNSRNFWIKLSGCRRIAKDLQAFAGTVERPQLHLQSACRFALSLAQ